MKAKDYFAEAERLPFGGLGDLASGNLLVLAPHPDDESLGCGGLLARAARDGLAAHVAIISDGCRSHPGSREFPPSRIAGLRRTETIEAARRLGISGRHVHFLALADCEVPSDGPRFEAAVCDLIALCDGNGSTALFATWRHDPHPDHRAVWAIAAEVAKRRPSLRLWAYPVWGWHLPADYETGEAPRGFRLDVAGDLGAKRNAIEAHASQLGRLVADDPRGFSLDPRLLNLCTRPFELFLAADETAPSSVSVDG
jgi:LmbE family N-acetylglucosaminyl deacetylase